MLVARTDTAVAVADTEAAVGTGPAVGTVAAVAGIAVVAEDSSDLVENTEDTAA